MKFLICILCLLSLTADSSAAFAAQPAIEEAIIGYPSRSMTELPTHLAAKKGFFRSEGLDVKLVQARSDRKSVV